MCLCGLRVGGWGGGGGGVCVWGGEIEGFCVSVSLSLPLSAFCVRVCIYMCVSISLSLSLALSLSLSPPFSLCVYVRACVCVTGEGGIVRI